MGRKGVSKRKPRQNKSKSEVSDNNVASTVQTAAKSHLINTADTGKAAPHSRKGKTSSSGGKKN